MSPPPTFINGKTHARLSPGERRRRNCVTNSRMLLLRCVLQDAATARLAIHAKSMKEEEEGEGEERVARTEIRRIGCLGCHAYKTFNRNAPTSFHLLGKFRPLGWANYFLLSRAKGLRGRGNIRHLLWYSAEEILSGILPMPTKPNSGYYEPVAAVADSHVTPSPLHTGTTRYTHHIPPATPLLAGWSF